MKRYPLLALALTGLFAACSNGDIHSVPVPTGGSPTPVASATAPATSIPTEVPTATPTPGAERLYVGSQGGGNNLLSYFSAPFSALSTPQPSFGSPSVGSYNFIAVDPTSGDVVTSVTATEKVTGYSRPNGGSSTVQFALGVPFEPEGIAFDSAHKLYLADYNESTIKTAVEPLGNATTLSSLTVPGLADPLGLAFDASDNMYVTTISGNLDVYAPPYASTPIVVAATAADDVNGIVFDPNTDQIVVDKTVGSVSSLLIYSLPLAANATPSQTITLTGRAYGLAIDSHGSLYVGTDQPTPNISVFTPPFLTSSAAAVQIPTPGQVATAMASGF